MSAALSWRVHLYRTSTQVIELDEDALEDGDNIVQAATDLAEPSEWFTDGYEVNRIEVSEDGLNWRSLPASEVLRLEKEATQ